MSFQNQISLAGRVSQDVNLTVKGERATLNGTIAVQKSYKNKETGEYGVDFFDFVIFSAVKDGKSYAQTMAELLKTGMYIGITGELANRPVSKTKDGKDFYNDSNVIVRNLQLLESKDAVALREAKKGQTTAQAPVQETPVEAPVEAPVEDAANFQDLAEQTPVMTSNPLELSEDDLPF